MRMSPLVIQSRYISVRIFITKVDLQDLICKYRKSESAFLCQVFISNVYNSNQSVSITKFKGDNMNKTVSCSEMLFFPHTCEISCQPDIVQMLGQPLES